MKKLLVASALIAGTCAHAGVTFHDSKAALDAAASTVLIETFDGFTPVDTNLPAPIVRGIATYAALAPSTNLVVTGANTTYTNFGVNLSPFKGSVLSTSGPDNIKVTFSEQLFAAGFDGYLNGLGAAAVSVYSGSQLLGTLNLPDPIGGGKVYVGIVSDTPFDRFHWISTGGATRNTAIDTISVATVPESSSYILMLAGLCWVGYYSRHTKAKRLQSESMQQDAGSNPYLASKSEA